MARFAPLGFSVADETMALMREVAASGELDALVPERVWQELRKALLSARPSAFLRTLHDAQALGPVSYTHLDVYKRQHQFMAGVSYNRREYANYGNYQQGWLPLDDYRNFTGDFPEPNWAALTLAERGTITQKAGYTAARLSLTDPLKMILGARYTDWESKNQGFDRTHNVTTPYAGLVYEINPVWSTYASYTEIFQPQTLRTINGSYLDPVDGKSYEVGVKGAWFEDRLNASLSVFRIEQDNVGQATNQKVIGNESETAYIAARGTVSRGFEFELNGELRPGWNASFGASRYVAKDINGSDINTILPQTAIKAFTSYTPQSLEELTVGGGVNWQNGIYYALGDVARIEQSSYALVSTFVRYRMAPQFSVQVNLNNLLDKKYYAQIAGYGGYGDGRNGSITFNWSF